MRWGALSLDVCHDSVRCAATLVGDGATAGLSVEGDSIIIT